MWMAELLDPKRGPAMLRRLVDADADPGKSPRGGPVQFKRFPIDRLAYLDARRVGDGEQALVHVSLEQVESHTRCVNGLARSHVDSPSFDAPSFDRLLSFDANGELRHDFRSSGWFGEYRIVDADGDGKAHELLRWVDLAGIWDERTIAVYDLEDPELPLMLAVQLDPHAYGTRPPEMDCNEWSCHVYWVIGGFDEYPPLLDLAWDFEDRGGEGRHFVIRTGDNADNRELAAFAYDRDARRWKAHEPSDPEHPAWRLHAPPPRR